MSRSTLALCASILIVSFVEGSRISAQAQQAGCVEAESSTAIRLSAESEFLRALQPQLGLLLGVEAMKSAERAGQRIPIAEQAVIDSLGSAGGLPFRGVGTAFALAISSDSRLVIIGEFGSDLARVWDLAASDPTASSIVLRGHTGGIVDVAIADDHHWAVTAGNFDQTARLWKLDSSDPSSNLTILPASAPVREVAINSQWVAVGSADGIVQLWKRSSSGVDATPIVLSGHGSLLFGADITQLQFSSDGNYLISSSNDTTVRVWKVTTPDPTMDSIVLTGQMFPILDATISANSRWIVSGAEDGNARVWDLQSARPETAVATLTGGSRRIRAVAIHPNSSLAATAGDDGVVRVWTLQSGIGSTPLAVLSGPNGWISKVAFSSNDKYLVACCSDHKAWLWELGDLSFTSNPASLSGHEGGIVDVAFSTDARYMVTCGWDGARLWDAQKDDLQAPYSTRQGFDHAASADGKWLYARIDGAKGNLWNLTVQDAASTLFVIDEDSNGATVRPIFSRDSRWLVTSGVSKTQVHQMSNGTPGTPRSLNGHTGTVTAIAISGDGQWVVTGGQDKTVTVWPLANGSGDLTSAHSITVATAARAVAITSDGRHVAIGTQGQLLYWEPGSSEVGPLTLSDGPFVWDVTITSDDKWLGAHIEDGVRLWDVSQSDPQGRTFQIGSRQADPFSLEGILAFSIDQGRWLATGGNDQVVHLWNLHANDPAAESKTLYGHTASITDMKISCDGRWLVSHSNNEVLMWDLTSDQPQTTRTRIPMPSKSRDLTTLSVSCDRGLLIIEPNFYINAGIVAPGGLLIWRTRPQDLIKQAQSAAGRELSVQERRTYLYE